MGRLESLTSLALGRGPYEEEVLTSRQTGHVLQSVQQYSENGRPRNLETKRLEREHVRAANEVMQVTGVVEDSISARIRAKESLLSKTQDTLTGLRLIEAGRAVLVAGVWGVMGFRRRILLYTTYSGMNTLELIRHEMSIHSTDWLLFSGIPTVMAFHATDWIEFYLETILEAGIQHGTDDQPRRVSRHVSFLKRALGCFSYYITLHLRIFSILQQLYLIPSSKLLPPVNFFIPFTKYSLIGCPPKLSHDIPSMLRFSFALVDAVAPFALIFAHANFRTMLARLVYRPIYKSLPRPVGESMFAGLGIVPPSLEFDAPDQLSLASGGSYYEVDEQTVARDGLPGAGGIESETRPIHNHPVSDDEEAELTQATLISFDVEATEGLDPTLGTWSAELRSANESKSLPEIKYKVTGLTLLPTIFATELIREAVVTILLIPLETLLIRFIGRTFRLRATLTTWDLWTVAPRYRTFNKTGILATVGIQIAMSGLIWGIFTTGIHLWTLEMEDDELDIVA